MKGSDEVPTAVVTGGTGALGRAVLLALLEDGWRVRVPVRDESAAGPLRGLTGSPGERLVPARADLTDADDVARFFDAGGTTIGALCNLVGGFTAASLADTSPAAWDRMMALNARAAFLCARAALPGLRAAGGGSIVNVAAFPAVERGAGGMAAYAASKSALVSLTHSLAKELRPDGITVNAIAPETIDTEANRDAMPDGDRSTWLDPGEIARVVRFLVGPDARIVTGAVLTLAKG